MKQISPPFCYDCLRDQDPNADGAALVIVLAFVVLLTGLIVAFFSRSITARQSSNANANQTKVELFANGAVASIIGDLTQEIVDGSDALPIQGGTLYTPKLAVNAVPASTTGIAGVPGLENLVKQSVGGNRASNVPTTKASLNGRAISPARWNTPLLMPAKSTADYTPDLRDGFTSPNWIFVARDGSNPKAWSANMQASNLAATNTMVLGRYSYMIYNEGGLLNANVAGYPDPSAAPIVPAPANSLPYYKSALAFADLTQLTDKTGAPLLTQSQIDQIVGWRNYASASGTSNTPKVSGALPSYTWNDAVGKANYYNLVYSNPTGFLTVANNVITSNGMTDRMFTNRQSLIQFFMQSLGGASSTQVQGALQYLGTFTRDLNQPSFAPAKDRPRVLAASGGGNDALGKDDAINPSFLEMRVQTAFTRYDGTQATVNDPLVNKRFLLQRLAWITYKGPSARRNLNDADIKELMKNGITQAFLQKGDDQTIQKYFGLQWNTNGWTYVGKGTGGAIAKLSEVRTQSREPDFIELLAAAINVGSIGKAATTASGTNYPNSKQFDRDTATNDAIIQIAANIIDQFDTDGYPTKITFAGADFYGVENLPYISGLRAGVLKLRESVPSTTGASPGDDKATPENLVPNNLKDCGVALWMQLPEVWNPHDKNCGRGVDTGFPTDFRITAGISAETYPNTSVATISTQTTNNVGGSAKSYSGGAWTLSQPFTTERNGGGAPFGQPYNRSALSTANSAMTFSVPPSSSGLFTEPTLLVKYGKPQGSNLAMGDGSMSATSMVSAIDSNLVNIKDSSSRNSWNGNGFLSDNTAPNALFLNSSENGFSNPGQAYVGFFGGVYPMRWKFKDTGDQKEKIASTYTPYLSNGNSSITEQLVLAYKDASGAWVPYDQKVMPFSVGFLRAPLGPNEGKLVQPTALTALTFDPRTARFGSPYTNDNTSSGTTANASTYPVQSTGTAGTNGNTIKGGWIDPDNAVLASLRSDAESGYGAFIRNADPTRSLPWGTASTLATIGWHIGGYSPDPNNIWVKPGLIAQNNPAVVNDGLRYSGDTGPGSGDAQFYSDSDGVVRRATAGFVPVGTLTGVPTARAQDYNTTSQPSTGRGNPRPNQSQSRPWILNRPFRNTGEMAYVFSGTPGKNLSFFTPESGYSALLDVFTVNDTADEQGLLAGRVDLNTRQPAVLKAILAGSYKDEQNPTTASGNINSGLAQAAAQAFVTRTSSTDPDKGPLINVSHLVGRWNSPVTISGSYTPPLSSNHNKDGSKSYVGFSSDLSSLFSSPTDQNVERFRESVIRSLSAVGQTRVWNLMIDVVAQTGRYPQTATDLDKFVVEGEQRCWVHLAIDRLTGRVIDKQVEIVTE